MQQQIYAHCSLFIVHRQLSTVNYPLPLKP